MLPNLSAANARLELPDRDADDLPVVLTRVSVIVRGGVAIARAHGRVVWEAHLTSIDRRPGTDVFDLRLASGVTAVLTKLGCSTCGGGRPRR